MDTLQGIVAFLSSLSDLELALGLYLAATMIIALEDWRLGLWALLAQYVLVGILLIKVMPLPVALVKVIVGGIVCMILYLTARRMHWGRQLVTPEEGDELSDASRDIFRMNLAFRLAAALLAAAVTSTLASRHPFLGQPEGVVRACYWLVVMGLVTALLASDPFKVGLGLLTFEAGFEVLFGTVEKSLSVAALLGVVNLLIALAVSYLAAAQIAMLVEERRR
jgi:hypothetical protein